VLIGINLGFTGADGAGVGTKSISRLKSCLPTASGCHQEEAETSVRRRFWAALSQGKSAAFAISARLGQNYAKSLSHNWHADP
jgi:hypothetical protein